MARQPSKILSAKELTAARKDAGAVVKVAKTKHADAVRGQKAADANYKLSLAAHKKTYADALKDAAKTYAANGKTLAAAVKAAAKELADAVKSVAKVAPPAPPAASGA